MSEWHDVLKALGDPLRVDIVDRVSATGETTVSELAQHFPITRQALTRHVRQLEEVGLLVGRRQGRQHLYRVDVGPLVEVTKALSRRQKSWDDALRRLARHVEAD